MEEQKITRREALTLTASVLGTTVLGANAFLTGCTAEKELVPFHLDDIALLDEVGETILPATEDSPGAKAAHIGEFMRTIVEDCYTREEYEIFVEGVRSLRQETEKRYRKPFMEMSASERNELLLDLDERSGNDDKHYFNMIRQLTIWGYFTSEPGATQALRYVPVPGRYDGCIPYKPGDKAWA